jgi:hypothetical protein
VNPAATLGHHLAEARRRGEVFGQAWPDAFTAALAPVPTIKERSEWADVLASMVSTWRAAFARHPSSAPETALLMLTDESRVPIAEHLCEQCDEEIPPERIRRRARFCSEACRFIARNAARRETVTV